MKSKIKLLVLIGLVASIFAGCYPNEDIYYSDTDVAITRYDEGYNFENAVVCVMLDDIAIMGEDGILDQEAPNDAHIRDEVYRNLQESTHFTTVIRFTDSTELLQELNDAGLTLTDVDIAVTLTALETDYYVYYPWSGWWYWGYYPYWKSGSLKSASNVNYYYYPWYPYGGTYYAYTTGSLLMDMINVKGIENPGDQDNIKLPMVWNGVISGILSGNNADQKSRVTAGIDQCFVQSPYLK